MIWWTSIYREVEFALDEATFGELYRAVAAGDMGRHGCVSYKPSKIFFDDRHGTLAVAGVSLSKIQGQPVYCTKYPVPFYDQYLVRAVFTRYPYEISLGSPLHAVGPAVARARSYGRRVSDAFACAGLTESRRVYIARREFVLPNAQEPAIPVRVYFERRTEYTATVPVPAVYSCYLMVRYSPDSDIEAIASVDQLLKAACLSSCSDNNDIFAERKESR